MTEVLKRKRYSYVVLRYVHDTITSEFINVGIVMVAPFEGLLFAKTRKTIGRIKGVFPDLDRAAFTQAMRSVDRGMNYAKKQVCSEGMFAGEKNASDYARMILPVDDSSLQWSPISSGVTHNLDQTFERLFERFVSRYDTHSEKRKSDDDVWRPFREKLTQRGVSLSLEKKVVRGDADSIEFDKAWKNGRWHVYEPVSFDLADADGIKDKARRWRGHLAAALEGTTEQLDLHFLLGRPSNPKLLSAYDHAIEILKGAPSGPEVIEEAQFDDFVDEVEDEYRRHLSAH